MSVLVGLVNPKNGEIKGTKTTLNAVINAEFAELIVCNPIV
ncbi:hypothetical protein A0O36_00893 [Piscirickettsiaceae bacterium NZ-RLO1]|nr:hypothetical protein A0O36_00893 [Piscirickettsiaceae bacterium NZ-RLO1]